MQGDENSEVRNTLFIAGGVALIAFGTGLVLAHPDLRRTLKSGLATILPELQGPMGNGIAGMLPDVQRYLKIRAM